MIYKLSQLLTHIWRTWSTPQNFCLAFINELEKQLFIKKKKTVEMAVEFLKNKEKHRKISLFYTSRPKILMIWKNHMRYSSWDMEWDRIVCHFGSFFLILSPNNPENHNCQKMKKASGNVIISHIYITKITIILCMLPEIWSATNNFLI